MDNKTVRKDLFVHDMIHNNPGLAQYDSDYYDPEFLKKRGYDGKTFDIFECAQFGLLWDKYDNIRNDGKKVFPYGSDARTWVEEKRAELKRKYSETIKAGLDVTFMMDIIVLPAAIAELSPETLDEQGRFNIKKPEMRKVLDCLFDEMFEVFPEIKGIYVRYGETYIGPQYGTPYHIGNNPITGEEIDFHHFLIGYLREKVCVEHDREIYYRNWGFGSFQYDPVLYKKITDDIPVHKNLYFCIKHTNGDFHRTFLFNLCLNEGKHKQIIEVQAAREYEGKGAYPDYVADGVINGYEEYKWLMDESQNCCIKDVINKKDSLIKGIWTWSRGGGWDGPYINGKNGVDGNVVVENGHELWPDLNAYVISQWAKDTSHSDKYYVMKYAEKELGMSVKDQEIFYEICLKSAHAVLLGRGLNHMQEGYNVWWTRDQNINPDSFIKNVRCAYEQGSLEAMLWEREESVKIWEEIILLAEQLADTVKLKDYIVTTCRYGFYLYKLYSIMHLMIAYDILGKPQKARELVSEYDNSWKEWEELKNTAKGCPTLYEKKNKPLDLIGYNGNYGFDAIADRYRK